MKNISKYWLFFGAILCINACYNPDKNTKVDPSQPTFNTSAQSVLFFKNVRQIFYDKIEMKEAKLDQYRIKERSEDTTQAFVNLVIVNNWMKDEAYILVEPNSQISHLDSLQIHWKDTLSGATGDYLFVNGNKEINYIFASQLYHSIQEKHVMEIEKNQVKIPFMASEDFCEPYRKTMIDFLRLVNVLK